MINKRAPNILASKTVKTNLEIRNIVGRISEQFVHNRAFCEESTILTGCVDFYTSMNIRYKGICEIKLESQKNRISDILI